MQLYNELAKSFKRVYIITYSKEDVGILPAGFSKNILILPKLMRCSDFIYEWICPFFYRKIFKNKKAIVKSNQTSGSWTAVIAKIFFKKNIIIRNGYVASLQNKFNPSVTFLKKIFYIVSEAVCYKLADRILVTYAGGLDHIQKKYHIPKSKFALIPNYVDIDTFRPLSIAKKRDLVFVGRLAQQKNLKNLLKALNGTKYSLDIYGNPLEGQHLKALSLELGLDVKFLAPVKNYDLPSIIQQYSIFILPSLYEGMPKVLLEAMACGMPCIGTNVIGTKEVIRDRYNGILVEPTVEAIKAGISLLLKDCDLRKRIGAQARVDMEKHFSFKKYVQKENKLFLELISEIK